MHVGLVRKVVLFRRMKPPFGWRGCRYAKDDYIMLSRTEGTSLPPSCKHCRNLGLRRCLQEANRHVPVLHPKKWTFLKLAWGSTNIYCWLGDAHWYEVAWITNGLVAKAIIAARSSNQTGWSHLRAIGEVTAMKSATV